MRYKVLKEEHKVFFCDNMHFNYILRWQNRRTISIRINENKEIYVSVPVRVNYNDVNKFLIDRIGWIKKTVEKIEKTEKNKFNFREGGSLYFLGKKYTVKINDKDGVFLKDNYIFVNNDIEKNIKEWFSFITKKIFCEQYKEAVKLFKIKNIPKLRITDMKTRWGSYSGRTNSINLNSKLIHADIKAIKGICIHELCHIKHSNHGKRFWDDFYKRVDKDEWKALKKRLENEWGRW